jgi:hypothetical protein
MFNLKQPRHIPTLPNSDLILRRSEMTRCATSGLMHCSMISTKGKTANCGGASKIRSGVLIRRRLRKRSFASYAS